jgi:glycosyltransferase involved in cell wall biosynthesis
LRVCHVTPHLPPDQAANALLPAHLGQWAVDAGDSVSYVAHPPRAGAAEGVAGPVVWVAPHQGRGVMKALRLSAIAASTRMIRAAGPSIAAADLVHVHSNGLLAETCGLWATVRWRKPVVWTMYGTEIWHYRPSPLPRLFDAAYRRATHITFYSRGLYDKAIELGLERPGMSVVYPPVIDRFGPVTAEERAALRTRLGLRAQHVLLNVKRLHPLAGQLFLIKAMPEVLRRHPDTQLVICGTGALLPELQQAARDAGVERQVTFAGLVSNAQVADYNRAADAFVLPSLLEALPTVAVEALACGTPVISADHPGGVELNALFGDDVAVVPRENVDALGHALAAFLDAPRRTTPHTAAVLEREFRPAAVAARFRSIYEQALSPTSSTSRARSST